jgi:glycosyltransferase involved in cell wall biosynthesis
MPTELLQCSSVNKLPLSRSLPGTRRPPSFRLQNGSQMKIAQIAPLMESVPPRLYGGTERVVSYLTEDLVAQGHDVTLFASGDSITAADLVPCCTQALRLDTAVSDVIPYYMLMLDKVRSRAAEFDVLHFHIDYFHFPIFRQLPIPSLTTLHGRQDHRDCLPFFAGFSDMPLISISDAQRAPLPHANFAATIHHGLPANLHEVSYRPTGGYLAFVGRISPEKGPVDAIRIAQSLGIPLKIAAKVDRVDESYFREVVQPMLSTGGVDFIGEISEREKGPFLRDATALLFPICWPEPFGLVMIEAMACGTPACLSRRRGRGGDRPGRHRYDRRQYRSGPYRLGAGGCIGSPQGATPFRGALRGAPHGE